MWAEARAHGLMFGWAQSSRDANGVAGMLTLSRSAEPLDSHELAHQELRMRWLVNVSHQALSRLLAPKLGWDDKPSLTGREVEVLKWTADARRRANIGPAGRPSCGELPCEERGVQASNRQQDCRRGARGDAGLVELAVPSSLDEHRQE
jgi:hypothetical protein